MSDTQIDHARHPLRARRRGRRSRSLTALVIAVTLAAASPATLALGLTASAATRTDGFKVSQPGAVVDTGFGAAVAASGDAVLVGAPDAEGDKGAVYVYTRTASGWDHQTTLADPGGAIGDEFGRTLVLDGDHLLVGAPGAGGSRGKVRTYRRDGASWDYRQTLAVDAADPSAWFGSALALDGGTALIGAPSTNFGRGQAHAYALDGSDWVHQQTLDGDASGDAFGLAVAIDGATAMVGAAGAQGSRGAAYVYSRDGAEWKRMQTLANPNDTLGDGFGETLAVENAAALVGATDLGTGYAHYFARVGSDWEFIESLVASDAGYDDHFGWPVTLQGGTALIGASSMDSDRGAAYLFDLSAGLWTERDKLTATGLEDSDYFASSVALDGDTGVCGQWPAVPGTTGGAYIFDGMLGEYTPVEIAGATRYETAIEASKRAFPHGAETVVIATGENWPDALGGAALAGAHDAPILLTLTSVLPDAVVAEIERLGAKDAIILGETGAVSAAVESVLAGKIGAGHVTRIGGADRYATARLVGEAVIDEMGANYDGTAFLATGADFPDALAASPLAAAGPWPIFLASPHVPMEIATEMKNMGVEEAIVLGGTAVVFQGYEDNLAFQLGAENVTRLAGATRYETAVKVAEHGVDEAGLHWNGVALATGENFPDALAGGPVQGQTGSVMLLTHTATLTPSTGAALQDQTGSIAKVRFLGGPGAITQTVRDDVAAILE